MFSSCKRFHIQLGWVFFHWKKLTIFMFNDITFIWELLEYFWQINASSAIKISVILVDNLWNQCNQFWNSSSYHLDTTTLTAQGPKSLWWYSVVETRLFCTELKSVTSKQIKCFNTHDLIQFAVCSKIIQAWVAI